MSEPGSFPLPPQPRQSARPPPWQTTQGTNPLTQLHARTTVPRPRQALQVALWISRVRSRAVHRGSGHSVRIVPSPLQPSQRVSPSPVHATHGVDPRPSQRRQSLRSRSRMA